MELSNVSQSINKIADKLLGWLESSIVMLPNIFIAVLVVAVFAFLGAWIGRRLHKSIAKTDLNKSLSNLFSTVIRVLVLCIGVVLALAVLDLQKTVFSLLAGVGVIGLALGFAFQDLAANFMSGVLIAFRSPIRIGDVVDVDGVLGTVKEVSLRETIVENFDGQEVFVPNKELTANKFTNYSKTGKRRLVLEIGVGYEDNLSEALSIFKKALTEVEEVSQDDEPQTYIKELGGSSVNLIGIVWFKYPGGSFYQIRSDCYLRAKTALEDAGFNIPFPIRTLDIPKETLKSLSQSAGMVEHSKSESNSDSFNQASH